MNCTCGHDIEDHGWRGNDFCCKKCECLAFDME